MTNSEAVARFEGLEKENQGLRLQLRITQMLGAGAVLCLLLAILFGGRDNPPAGLKTSKNDLAKTTPEPAPSVPSERIVTRELVVIDANQTPRAIIRCDEKGQPVLSMMGTKGSTIMLGYIGNGSVDRAQLAFLTADQQLLAHVSGISGTPPGSASNFGLHDGKDHGVISLNVVPGAYSTIKINEPEDLNASAGITMAAGGFPHMQLMDSEGKHVFDAPEMATNLSRDPKAGRE